MTYMFVLTAGALLPALLALYDVPEIWIWRGCGRAVRTADAVSSGHLSAATPQAVGKGPPPAIFAVFVVVGSAATLAMLGYIAAGFLTAPPST